MRQIIDLRRAKAKFREENLFFPVRRKAPDSTKPLHLECNLSHGVNFRLNEPFSIFLVYISAPGSKEAAMKKKISEEENDLINFYGF